MPLITKEKSNYIYILIAIIVAALTVCGILIYIENYNNELYFLNQSVGMKPVEKNQEQNANLNQETSTKSGVEKETEALRNKCSEEGEAICGALGCTSGCCPGLAWKYKTYPWRNKSNEVVCIEEMPFALCIKCGDGICGKGENWCVCPEDCPKPDLKDLPSLSQ